MPSKVKRGGAAPEYGLTAVNLGNGLRRQLERVCRRQGISLTEFVRTSVHRGISEQWFWKFQALRYFVQSLRMALGSEFVSKTLGFSVRQRRELDWTLREFQALVERKAEDKFAETLTPEQREKRYGGSDASGRQIAGIVERPKDAPHWDFQIPEVERILDAL
jgi:hypothetical protein